MCNRIKYTDEKKCINRIILLGTPTAVTQKFLEQSRVGVGVVWSEDNSVYFDLTRAHSRDWDQALEESSAFM